MTSRQRLPLAVTMGEPAGIGGEIAMRAWLSRREAGLPPFFLLDDPSRLAALARKAGLTLALEPIAAPEETAHVFARGLPVLPLFAPVSAEPGRPHTENTAAVIEAIDRAVAFAREKRAAAIVTNPINKEVLYAAGFNYPGHTEYLGALAGGGMAGRGAAPVMMLACPELRVVPVTIHLPLKEAVSTLTSAAIIHAGRVTAAGLQRDFGIARPRLAIAGLNPHAGEGGSLGREEIEIIAPAAEVLRREGILVSGPAPADTLFHAAARRNYDAALCMYHDQALIPLKTINFEGGVNVTLGLPFIRTSPDHGTAFDIAGKGIANPASLVAALRLAGEMARNRQARQDTAA